MPSDFLKGVPLFSKLEPHELDDVEKIISRRKFRKGTIIFAEGDQGDSFCLIIAGRIKISKSTDDGREQILHFLKAGDIFGELVVFSEGQFPATAEVIEDAEIGFINGQDMIRLLQGNVEIALKLLKILATRLRQAQAKVRDLALKDTFSRTAGLLLRMAKRNGVETPAGIKIEVNISRQEMASMIGTSRETVTRILSDLARSGIIKTESNSITILDRKKLEQWS